MTPSPFDASLERRSSGCLKWTMYDEDVLPMWVADMDFQAPEVVRQALHGAVEHGVFGYHFDSPELRALLTARMGERYDWDIRPSEINFLPNLVSAINFVCMAYAEPGDEVLVLTPAYPPFLNAPTNSGRVTRTVDLAVTQSGRRLHYEIDFDALEAAITPRTKLFIHCSPHNPVGRVWTRAENERVAEFCLRHNLVICSDDIHCDLLLDDVQHMPLAILSPEVAARTITLMAPSKTFNLPTLGLGFAITQNEALRQRLQKAMAFFVPHPGALGYAAAIAAYRDGQPWLDELLPYLRGNRDFLVETLEARFPSVHYTVPEATYLAWLDWRALGLEPSPYQYFLEKARVAMNDGATFGKVGTGFTRLNLGTSRERLALGLEKLERALAEGM